MSGVKGKSGRPGGNPQIAVISKLYSTGPKTEEGKKRSSQNSFKHGMYSKSYSLGGLKCSDCNVKDFCTYYSVGREGCRLLGFYNSINSSKVRKKEKCEELIPLLLDIIDNIWRVEMKLYGMPTAYTIKAQKKLLKLLPITFLIFLSLRFILSYHLLYLFL